jgi:hypothetical protein
MIGKILLFLLMCGFSTSTSQAIVKEVNFESDPSGAEVYFLRGTRQELLGTTPLKYQAEFHSEISILRFAVKKPGFKTQNIEVSGQQDKVSVKLTSQGFAADPAAIDDPTLRSLQARLVPTIDQTLSQILASKSEYDFEMSGLVGITKLDDKIFLILPLTLAPAKGMRPLSMQGQNEEFLRTVWDRFGQKLMTSLGSAVSNESLLNGIILDLNCSRLRQGFEVGSHLESRIEMECVPGTEMKQVYNPCVRRRMETHYDRSLNRTVTREGGCEGGYETRSIFNPCLTKVPVTRREVKVDPKVTISGVQHRAQYVYPIELAGLAVEQDKVFSRLGVLLTNEKGEIVSKRGFVPSTLPKIPR